MAFLYGYSFGCFMLAAFLVYCMLPISGSGK